MFSIADLMSEENLDQYIEDREMEIKRNRAMAK